MTRKFQGNFSEKPVQRLTITLDLPIKKLVIEEAIERNTSITRLINAILAKRYEHLLK